MNISKEIPVVIAFDENVLIQAKVCILSLLKSSTQNECYHIICMHKNLTKELLNQFDYFLSKYRNCSWEYINMHDLFKSAYLSNIGPQSIATYYRFLIPRLLSKYDRVIYVDVDYIFRDGLYQLYFQENMDGYYLAGVSDWGVIKAYQSYLLNRGITSDEYINAGFLLMNLKLINQDNMVDLWLREVSDEKKQWLFMDQDILNLTCQGKIKLLKAKYNFIPPGYKDLLILDEYKEAAGEGNLHYAGPKPWKCWKGRKGMIWWGFYFKLPFSQRDIAFFIRSWCMIVYYFFKQKFTRIIYYLNRYLGIRLLKMDADTYMETECSPKQ